MCVCEREREREEGNLLFSLILASWDWWFVKVSFLLLWPKCWDPFEKFIHLKIRRKIQVLTKNIKKHFYCCFLVAMGERVSVCALEQNFLKVLFKHLLSLKFHPFSCLFFFLILTLCLKLFIPLFIPSQKSTSIYLFQVLLKKTGSWGQWIRWKPKSDHPCPLSMPNGSPPSSYQSVMD